MTGFEAEIAGCRIVRKIAVASLPMLLLFASGPSEAKPGPELSTSDYEQIHELYARFAHAIDSGKGKEFAATWTDDGEFTGGRPAGRAGEVRTPIKGHAALLAMGNSLGIGMRHFVTNIVLTPTPTGAKGSAYLLLLQARNSPPTIVETAIYDDTLVKCSDGWKFKKRIVWRDDDDITPYKFKPLPVRPSGGAN